MPSLIDRLTELIAAVIIALGLSLAFAGLYSSADARCEMPSMPMIVLMIVANLVSMAVGAGYFAYMGRSCGGSSCDERSPLAFRVRIPC